MTIFSSLLPKCSTAHLSTSSTGHLTAFLITMSSRASLLTTSKGINSSLEFSICTKSSVVMSLTILLTPFSSNDIENRYQFNYMVLIIDCQGLYIGLTAYVTTHYQ